MVSPGVPVATTEIMAARERGVPVVGDVELFATEVKAPVAAIFREAARYALEHPRSIHSTRFSDSTRSTQKLTEIFV